MYNKVDCERFGLDAMDPPTFYKANGCKQCNYQGYRGRSGIYELVVVDDQLRSMIHDGTSEHEIEHYARRSSPGIRQDGLRRVLMGDTTVDEVLRVTRED
jgi:general secretion pathway protein E